MAANDLTSLQRVRQWLGVDANNVEGDGLLRNEISRISATTLAYLSKPSLLKTQYTDLVSGTGMQRLMLKRYPVLSLVSLTVNTTVVPPNPTPPFGGGWVLQPWDGMPPGRPQEVLLSGYGLTRGLGTVTAVYYAGYSQTNEPAVVPATGTTALVAANQNGLLARDDGVAYANGMPLAAVATAPAAGQYVSPNPFANPPVAFYQFAAADAGKAVLLSYSYIPFAIEGAVTELVAERVRYRDRIGQRTKMLSGNESMGYDTNDMPKWFLSAVQPFKSVVLA